MASEGRFVTLFFVPLIYSTLNPVIGRRAKHLFSDESQMEFTAARRQ
jgi:hypothetical protein